MIGGVRIVRVSNGFKLVFTSGEYSELGHVEVFQDDEMDDLKSIEEVLVRVIDYFAKSGNRFDAERICIRRESGDKYEAPEVRESLDKDDGVPF